MLPSTDSSFLSSVMYVSSKVPHGQAHCAGLRLSPTDYSKAIRHPLSTEEANSYITAEVRDRGRARRSGETGAPLFSDFDAPAAAPTGLRRMVVAGVRLRLQTRAPGHLRRGRTCRGGPCLRALPARKRTACRRACRKRGLRSPARASRSRVF